jgi:hypothetical protein
MTYLSAHARPGDRVAALPHGGAFYFFGLPPASRWTLMYPAYQGYTTQAEYDGFWHELADHPPRFVVTTPFAAGQPPVPMPLSGYRPAVVLPFDPHLRAWIYQRVD